MIGSLLACALVLLVFAAARAVSARLGNPPWASPVLVAAIAVAAGLGLAGRPVAGFLAQTAPLRWLLGPALVALALVIDANRAALRGAAVPILVAVTGGTIVGVGSAVGLAKLFGLAPEVTAAVTTKTVSTPFAVAVMTAVGGPMALAAALAVLTGVIGALLVPWLFDRIKLRDDDARAIGLGVAAHLVGTDWLTRRDPRAGGLAALAMVIAGVGTALVLPVLWGRLMG